MTYFVSSTFASFPLMIKRGNSIANTQPLRKKRNTRNDIKTTKKDHSSMRLKKSAVRVPREFRAHSVPYDRDYDQFVHSVLCRLTPQLDADP